MPTRHPAHSHPAVLSLAAAAAGLLFAGAAHASLVWNWSYSGSGIDAHGSMTTGDGVNADGFYRITGISGVRNGDAITGLQPTGTAIPGNEPYVVDNLVKAAGGLTGDGFGYATRSGTYANVFFADWSSPPGDVEFSSIPAVPSTAELPVSFRLAPSVPSVPEPSTMVLWVLGGVMLASRVGRHRPARPRR